MTLNNTAKCEHKNKKFRKTSMQFQHYGCEIKMLTECICYHLLYLTKPLLINSRKTSVYKHKKWK